MMVLAGKLLWCLGVVGWFAIRYPYARRAKKVGKMRVAHKQLERVLLTISTCGLGIIPALFVFTAALQSADYPMQFWQPWMGTVVFALALWMFHRTHKDLGKNWSVTLEVRTEHALVTSGIYQYLRHPMYSAFWLWAIAQLLLLPNWIAGLSGLIGFGMLYFFRVRREEAMMLDTFGNEYRDYMKRSWRIIPRFY
jgi:protein-S-isoprenylcysteine O-methyltransferase Ste14